MNQTWEQIKIVDGEPSERIIIIARNLHYVKVWCQTHRINHNSRRIQPILKITDMFGFTDVWYVDLGTDNHDLREFIEQFKASNSIKPLNVPDI